MALRTEDKTWVAEEIRAAIHEHLNPHGWRKLQAFLPLAGLLGVFMALLAFAGAGWKYAFSKIEAEAQFQTHTTDTLNRTAERVTRIEGTLGILQAQTAATKYSTIPVKELKRHRDELSDVRKNLASLPLDTPNLWPASFQIITLVSRATSDVEKIAEQPEGSMDNVVSDPIGGIRPVENSRIVLRNLVQGVVFKNSIVRFDPSVRLVNDVFINCVFIFPATQNPPKPLQEIGKTLLTSDLAKVTINSLPYMNN
jgi:hypothetical protein